MERLYRGEVDGILCRKLDRLAPNLVDQAAIIWAIIESRPHESKSARKATPSFFRTVKRRNEGVSI